MRRLILTFVAAFAAVAPRPPAPRSLVIVYTGDANGSIEDCG